MMLDKNIQIAEHMTSDNYTFDMTRNVIFPELEYENALIIGGGDLRIA